MMQRFRFIKEHVLGINLRNSNYIFQNNPISLYPLVDNKIETKNILEKHDVATPKKFFTISSGFELYKLNDCIKDLKDFVIKPANGFGGEGVCLLEQKEPGKFYLPNDHLMPFKKIHEHCQDIMAGMFSITQIKDEVLCEEKIKVSKEFAKLSFKGIPDIRVIVYKKIPVLAMLRCSTYESDGKANLHQGGIGVGVDLTTGKTKHAFHRKNYIKKHPDTLEPLIGYKIPHWDKVLDIAIRCSEIIELGYLGVDIVLDEVKGPLVLELNARPGLMVQMANQIGLKSLLESCDQELQKKDYSFSEKKELALKLHQLYSSAQPL